jgi:hypothetical protein
VTRFAVRTLAVSTVLALLTGCVLSTPPGGRPPSDDPSPSIALAVSLDTSGILVTSGDGSVTPFDYFTSEPDAVVSALTTAFGFDAARIDLPAGGTRYSWGSFELTDTGLSGAFPTDPRLRVRAGDDHAGEVPVTLGGVAAVGQPVDDILDQLVVRSENAIAQTFVGEWSPIAVDPGALGLAPDVDAALVSLVTWNDLMGTITDFTAPEPRW